MSFLHDDKVLAELLYSLVKQGQDASTTEVAKKLVQKLEKEYAGVPDITSTTGAELKPEHISNLSQLLQFLDTNQVSINGKRLVYKDAASVPANDRESYATPIPVSSRDAETRKQKSGDYQVNLPLMTQYLKHLQEKGSKEDNRILTLISGSLIDEYNQYNPESGLTRKPVSEPGNPNEMPDDTIVDNFAYKLFDVHSVGQNTGGTIVLTARDLKSREALNAWLQGKVPGSGDEAKIVQYDAKGMPTRPISYTVNPCDVLRTMSMRAQQKLQLSKSPQETKAANFYLKKVQELAPSFLGADGKACQLNAAATPVKEDAGSSGAAATDQAAGQNISRTMQTLPFATANINFDRIRSFFRLIESFMGNHAGVAENIADAEQNMTAAANMTKIPNDPVFPLGIEPAQFSYRLKNQMTPGNDYPKLINLLEQVLTATRQVIEIFYSAYGNRINENSNWKAYILGQIGRSPTDNSLYARNIGALQQLQNATKLVQR